MKKLLAILTILFAVSTAFADMSRFYENGKVIDTMYVDSHEGLRVRDKPSLQSNRICGLPHRFPVKVVAIGKEQTIDGITAPWVEILIPRYEWRTGTPEYGWLFGGYLSNTLPEFQSPQTAEELQRYLESSYWHFVWEGGGDIIEDDVLFIRGNVVILNESNYHATFFDEAVTWYDIKDPSILSFNQEYTQKYRGEWIPLLPRSDVKFSFQDVYFYADDWRTFCNNDYLWDFGAVVTYPEAMGSYLFQNKRCYALYDGDYTIIHYYIRHNYSSDSIIDMAIESGISAKGTKYEKQYHDYWDPIMALHQKKISEMY
ncbi:MAG: SH3 domain-containing protein [Treponema sp.]|nr:SH3 domain-containing protein [Treponema sp.]